MIPISLTVNGQRTEARVVPRQHLADFLREELSLTGTHLGCEQGVCGACTILVDGVPVRSCITYAVACDGADVRTIEGFGTDPLMGELRSAFSEHHGLQCGFCTPGMLIASRDIVRRHGELDEATIRHELSGNLCRCTGYMGIVRAVRAVSIGKVAADASGPAAMTEAAAASPTAAAKPAVSARPAASSTMAPVEGGWTELRQRVRVEAPPDRVWPVMKDVTRVAACLPGASIDTFDGSRVTGMLTVRFGPIRAAFRGDGTVSYEDGTSSGLIEGGGRDTLTGTQARGEIRFGVGEAPGGSEIDVVIRYRITGALAQFARTSLVQNFVGHLAGVFADNLVRVAAGETAPTATAAAGPELNTLAVLLALAKGWLRRLFGR